MDQQVINYMLWQEERGFVWPTMPPARIETSTPCEKDTPASLAVVCEAEGDELALLNRMMTAIGINEFPVVPLDDVYPRIRLILRAPPSGVRLGEPVDRDGGFDFYSYHPRTLLKVPELKPIAWAQLQSFAAHMVNSGVHH